MDMLEKVERLREKANGSYEEAKAALEEAGGDLLDAIVILERQGKVNGPRQEKYSTEYEQQSNYIRVKDKVEEQKKESEGLGRSIGRAVRRFWAFIRSTSFLIRRKGETIFTMPTLVFILLLFFFWQILLPAMIISLFFEVRYSFSGDAGAEKANTILEKAGDFANDVRNEFRRPEQTGNGPESTQASGESKES